jgi:GNAT superfamily N-acetyltransferase
MTVGIANRKPVDVRAVPVEATFPLRQAVLRPHQRVDEMTLPTDGTPDAGAYAAVDAAGRIVGTGLVSRTGPPWAPDEPGWQIRGMAVEPELRGQGIGSAVLATILDHIRARGGGLAWCNARTPAQGVYARAGFVPVGEVFEIDRIGLHIVMTRTV